MSITLPFVPAPTTNTILFTAANNQPPTISEITGSPLKVKPNGQVIIRAEILSGKPTTFVSWHHGNTTYIEYLQEDPFCDPAREVSYKGKGINEALCTMPCDIR